MVVDAIDNSNRLMPNFPNLISHEESTGQSYSFGGISQPVNQVIPNTACNTPYNSSGSSVYANLPYLTQPAYAPPPYETPPPLFINAYSEAAIDTPPSVPRSLVVAPTSSAIQFGYTNAGHDLVGLPDDQDGNVLLIGGPGSGKSINVIIHAILKWAGPVVALDIKGELQRYYEAYSKERRMLVLDPSQPDCFSIDPFTLLDDTDEMERTSLVQEIARILIPKANNTSDPFWVNSARSLLAAALLGYYWMGLSFPQAIISLLTIPHADLFDELNSMNDMRIKMLIGDFSTMHSKVLSSVCQELRTALNKLTSEELLMHFFRGTREGASTFSWSDLGNSVVFIRIPEEKVEPWGAGITLILSLLFRYLERRPDSSTLEGKASEPCLVVIDELPRFGELPRLPAALATLRSKQVHFLVAVQSLSQLDGIYGSHKRSAMMDCFSYQVILRVSDPDTQRLLADRIGTQLVYAPSVSLSHKSNKCRETSYQVGTRREFKIEPSKLASINYVIIATPHGVFTLDKIPPLPRPSICSPQQKISLKDSGFRTIQQRAKDAEDHIRAYKKTMKRDTDIKYDQFKWELGDMLLKENPELYALAECRDTLEHSIRSIAKSDEIECMVFNTDD